MAALALTTACGSHSSNPAAPTPGSSTPTTIVVSAASAPTKAFQLVATARFSDSTTRDVTSTAKWESSNTSVARVAPGGMVTVLGTGDVEFRATFETVTGAVQLRVSPAPDGTTFVLSGVVREVPPAEHTVAGARVQIVEGPNAGASVLSDSNGVFQFTGLTPARITVTATADGYQPWKLTDVLLSADMSEDAWLVPNPAKNASGETATARCKDGSWSWSQDRDAACSANGGTEYFVCPGPFCEN
jgi:hypothetical protein